MTPNVIVISVGSGNGAEGVVGEMLRDFLVSLSRRVNWMTIIYLLKWAMMVLVGPRFFFHFKLRNDGAKTDPKTEKSDHLLSINVTSLVFTYDWQLRGVSSH